MEELHALSGVGRKTANVVLGNVFGIPGMVVDTHVMRLSNRLGFVKGTDAVKLELELQKLIPEKNWTMYSHYLITHGRAICVARNPDCKTVFESALSAASLQQIINFQEFFLKILFFRELSGTIFDFIINENIETFSPFDQNKQELICNR